MAITNVTGQRVPPAAALVAEIDRRRNDGMVKLSGMGPVLDMLRAYIVQTDARLSDVEAGCRACKAFHVEEG
jgi:hypothetical protein